MKVFITGGTGFIGSHLVRALVKEGHKPFVLTRSPRMAARRLPKEATVIEGNPTEKGIWRDFVGETDAAVNLAGESIFGRWTKVKKTSIRKSRIESTRNLVEAIPDGRTSPYVLVSGSAVGYYGHRGEEMLTEADNPGDDFLSGIAVSWEGEAQKAAEKGCRVALLRSGIVLGEKGALEQMVRPFRMYGGGPIGTGRQYLSWVHISDEVGLIMLALTNEGLFGPLNATSPNPVTNAEFSRILGSVLKRPSWIPSPSFAVRIALGEFADVILNGQRVFPEKALNAGYKFLFPDLPEALKDIL